MLSAYLKGAAFQERGAQDMWDVHRNRIHGSRSVTDSFRISVTIHENGDRNVTVFFTFL